jgi:hypothetical protein
MFQNVSETHLPATMYVYLNIVSTSTVVKIKQYGKGVPVLN